MSQRPSIGPYSNRQYKAFQGRIYCLTLGLPDQTDCPGEQDWIHIIANANRNILHGRFNSQGTFAASAMRYIVPEGDLEQC